MVSTVFYPVPPISNLSVIQGTLYREIHVVSTVFDPVTPNLSVMQGTLYREIHVVSTVFDPVTPLIFSSKGV